MKTEIRDSRSFASRGFLFAIRIGNRVSLKLHREIDDRANRHAGRSFREPRPPSSTQHVDAMSRWIHGVSSANSLMNHAPVLAPPPLPLPVLRMSAMLLLIIS